MKAANADPEKLEVDAWSLRHVAGAWVCPLLHGKSLAGQRAWAESSGRHGAEVGGKGWRGEEEENGWKRGVVPEPGFS